MAVVAADVTRHVAADAAVNFLRTSHVTYRLRTAMKRVHLLLDLHKAMNSINYKVGLAVFVPRCLNSRNLRRWNVRARFGVASGASA